jgi:hypothetical protein
MNKTNSLRGRILALPEGSLMGILVTSEGKEIYFSERSYRVSLKDSSYSLERMSIGDLVVMKTKELSPSILRPIEFVKLA